MPAAAVPTPAVVYTNGVPAGGYAVYPPPAGITLDPRIAWKILRRRWMLIVSLGVIVAGLAAVPVWFLLPAQYTASAWLQLHSNPPRTLFPERDGDYYQTFRQNQAAIVKMKFVLAAALRKPGIAELQTLRSQIDPIAWLERELRVEFPGGGELMRISLSGENPAEIASIVNAVTEAYLDETVNKERARRLSRLSELDKLYSEKEKELRDKRQYLRSVAEQLRATDTRSVVLRQEALLARYGELQREHMRLLSDLYRKQISLGAEQARGKQAAALQIPEELIEAQLRADPVLQKLADQMDRLAQYISQYERLAADPENNPNLRRYRSELENLQKSLEDRKKEIRPKIIEVLKKSVQNQVEFNAKQIEEEIALMRQHEQLLRKEIQELAAEVDKVGARSVDLEFSRYDVEQLNKTIQKIAEAREALTVELNSPYRVRHLQSAEVPQVRDSDPKVKMATLAALAAFAFVTLLIGVVEYRIQRVDSADDIKKELGMTVVGALPAVAGSARRRLFGGNGKAHWQHLLTESVDGIRTLLVRQAQVEPVRVITITSALGGEGKTTLASHLATSLARAGRRTLLIDGDLRRPALHQVFGIEQPAPGLSEYLRGEADLPTIVRQTRLPGLDLLCVGQADRIAIQELAKERLPALLQRLRNEYDFIVIDSAPVLPVADTLLISQYTDGVLFSLLNDVSQSRRVQAAKEKLHMLGIRVLGAVLCGANGKASDYYYYDYQYQSNVT